MSIDPKLPTAGVKPSAPMTPTARPNAVSPSPSPTAGATVAARPASSGVPTAPLAVSASGPVAARPTPVAATTPKAPDGSTVLAQCNLTGAELSGAKGLPAA